MISNQPLYKSCLEVPVFIIQYNILKSAGANVIRNIPKLGRPFPMFDQGFKNMEFAMSKNETVKVRYTFLYFIVDRFLVY